MNKKPVGLIEAKREEEGVRLTMHEEQSADYAAAKLKYLNNERLPFVYESTGELPALPTTVIPSLVHAQCLLSIVLTHLSFG